MTQRIADGPYKGILPFLNIEGISIAPTELRLLMSNEIVQPTGPSRIITFGNFIFFSSNKAIIEALNVDNAALKTKIIREQQNNQLFSLDTRKDFKYKTHIDKSRNLNIAHHTYTKIHTMDLDTKHTNDLYVLVASFSRDSNNNITIGSVLKDTLLIAGRPPLESDLYALKESANFYGQKGGLWPDSVHSHTIPTGQGSVAPALMVGRYHTAAPHPTLLSEKIINVKSKDLRILAPAAAATPEIIVPGTPSAANIADINVPANADRGSNKAEAALGGYTGPLGYFSPVHLSRDSDGVVYGYFGFDLVDFFKENSLFGKYIQNPEALAACMEVVDIRISRTKTKKLDIRSNKLTAAGSKTGLCKLKTSAAEYPYIHVGSLNDGVQIIKKFNSGEVIGIAFRDDDAAQYEVGGLKYYAQVLVSDKSKDAFTAISNMIASSIASCNVKPAKCGDLVSLYMASIKFISGITGYGPFTPKEWQKTLLILTSEFSPETRSHIVNALIRGYRMALEAILNSNKQSTKSNVADFHSSIYNVSAPGGLEAKTELNGGLDITNPANVGLNYIDDYLSNTGAVIPSITYQVMQQRIATEEEKFPSATENAETTNSFGYMTPTSVALGAGPPINTTSQNIDMGGSEALFAASPPTATSMVDLSPSSQTNANAAVLSSMGVSIAPLTVSLNRLVAVSELVTPQTVATSQILGDNATALNIDSIGEASSAGSQQSIINIAATQQGAYAAYAGNLANQLLGDEFDGFNLPTPPATNMSTTPQALPANTPASNEIPPEPVPAVLTFGSLVRVEYLSSYTPQGGIGAENWSTLTDVVFNQARSNSEMLICRLVKIEQASIAENTIFTPLTTLFVIGPLRNINIKGVYGPLLRSYLMERVEYKSQFDSLSNAYDKEVLYSQVIPMDAATLAAAAETPTPPAPTTPTMTPNQTIPAPLNPPIIPLSLESPTSGNKPAMSGKISLNKQAGGKGSY